MRPIILFKRTHRETSFQFLSFKIQVKIISKSNMEQLIPDTRRISHIVRLQLSGGCLRSSQWNLRGRLWRARRCPIDEKTGTKEFRAKLAARPFLISTKKNCHFSLATLVTQWFGTEKRSQLHAAEVWMMLDKFFTFLFFPKIAMNSSRNHSQCY